MGSISISRILILICALVVVANAHRSWNCVPWSPDHKQSSNNEFDSKPSCATPVSELESAVHEPLRPLDSNDVIPSWYNPRLWKIGQKFAQKNFFAVFFTAIASGSMFTTLPLIEPIVVITGKSGKPNTSNPRYLATMLQMKLWYEDGLTSTAEDQITENIFESLVRVRAIHYGILTNYTTTQLYGPVKPSVNAKNFERRYEEQMWAAFHKDLDASDVPQKYRDYPEFIRNYSPETAGPVMNQLMFSLVQWACMALPVIQPERLGIHDATEEELTGWIHMWAVIGYGIGINDRYNIALQPSLGAAKKHYRDIFNIYFLPTLFQARPDGERMLEHFYRGFLQNLFGPEGDKLVSVYQMLLLSMEDAVGIKCNNVRSQLMLIQSGLRGPVSQVTNMLRYPLPRNLVNEFIRGRYFISGARRFLNIDATDPVTVSEKSYYF